MIHVNSAFKLETCARPNILSLQPYRCARDEYPDNGTNILLDANENAIGSCLLPDGSHSTPAAKDPLSTTDPLSIPSMTLHRYPDPHQVALKELWCQYRSQHRHTSLNLSPANLFVGNGSDEAIDNIMRIFCVPSRDRILICPPTYGMYTVTATIHDVATISIPLTSAPDFQIDVPAVLDRLSAPDANTIKEIFLCSPGNPTAGVLRHEDVRAILEHPTWNGVVVLDEAYIDFAKSPSASLVEWVLLYPNLVVLQTLSKAFGCAGARIGAAFTSEPIARLMNAVKAPYNVPSPSSVLGCLALQGKNLAAMNKNCQNILQQRDRLLRDLPKITGIGRFRGGNDSNFLLVELLDLTGRPCSKIAMTVYQKLAIEQGVVVRFRGREHGCEGCLRITVGTEKEVDHFLKTLTRVIADVRQDAGIVKGDQALHEQDRANAVIA